MHICENGQLWLTYWITFIEDRLVQSPQCITKPDGPFVDPRRWKMFGSGSTCKKILSPNLGGKKNRESRCSRPKKKFSNDPQPCVLLHRSKPSLKDKIKIPSILLILFIIEKVKMYYWMYPYQNIDKYFKLFRFFSVLFRARYYTPIYHILYFIMFLSFYLPNILFIYL